MMCGAEDERSQRNNIEPIVGKTIKKKVRLHTGNTKCMENIEPFYLFIR